MRKLCNRASSVVVTLGLALSIVTAPVDIAAFASEIKVDVLRVPNSTEILVRGTGTIDAPFKSVVAALCDWANFNEVNDAYDETYLLSSRRFNALVAKPFQDVDDAEDAASGLGESRTPNCPGEDYVLSIEDLPWPLSNQWAVNIFRGEFGADGRFGVYYESKRGSAIKSTGSYVIWPGSENKTKVESMGNYDLDLSVPEFILDLAASTTVPGIFEALEEKARRMKVGANTAQTRPFEQDKTGVAREVNVHTIRRSNLGIPDQATAEVTRAVAPKDH